MYAEDRVLIAYMPRPSDFQLVQHEGWYRIPQRHAPKGLYSEYYAFYFGKSFGAEKWAIHYYAQNLGYELVTRRTLIPNEPDHPRADDLYYKIQLGPLQKRPQPIVSLRWRRITFLHTTWDRFQDAAEINDLLITGGDYVDRVFATLKERGIPVERNVQVKEAGKAYEVPLVVGGGNGRINIHAHQLPKSEMEFKRLIDKLFEAAAQKGDTL